jgi:hypothetical protein
MNRICRNIAPLALVLVFCLSNLWTQESSQSAFTTTITVQDLTTGQPITNGETISALDNYTVTVTTNGINCAGQLTVTALGAPGFPPEVGVLSTPFFIGPYKGGSDSFTTSTVMIGVLPNGTNDFKISSSCNAPGRGKFSFSHFEFFANVN